MNNVAPSSSRDLLGLMIMAYATLLGLAVWLFHMIRRAPHPEIHLRRHSRKNAGKR